MYTPIIDILINGNITRIKLSQHNTIIGAVKERQSYIKEHGYRSSQFLNNVFDARART